MRNPDESSAVHLARAAAAVPPWIPFAVASALAGTTDATAAMLAGRAVVPSLATAVVDAGLVAAHVLASIPLLGLLQALAGEPPDRETSVRLWRSFGGFLGLVCLAAVVLAVVRPVNRQHEEAYWAVALAATLGTWGVPRLVLRYRRAAGSIAAGGVAAAVALVFDLALDRSTYRELHAVVQLFAVATLSAVLARWRAPRADVRAWGASVAVLAAVAATAFAIQEAAPGFRMGAALEGRWFPTLTALPASVLDADGDGASAIVWGGDCDDSNPRAYPAAEERPGPVDHNCNGVADVEDTDAARGLAPAFGEPALSPASARRVVLVTIDTARADVLVPEYMPNTVATMESGLRFARAYAPATRTSSSMPAFARSQWNAPTLIAQLQAAGVQCFAAGREIPVTDPEVARASLPPSLTGHDPAVVEQAVRWLSAPSERPQFLWLHLLGLHDPYVSWDDAGDFPPHEHMSHGYLSEARHLDGLLAPVWSMLADRLGRDTVLVLTSDHGEAFGEHGVHGHTRTGFEEVVRVPLAVVGGGMPATVNHRLATGRSVPATILGAFGLHDEAVRAERFGRSLWRLREHPDGTLSRFVVVESARNASGATVGQRLFVYVREDVKVLVGALDAIAQAFDLEADAAEREEVTLDETRLGEALRELAVAQDLGAFPPQSALSRFTPAAWLW